MVLDQTVDETAGLELVEGVKFVSAKHLLGEPFDVLSFETVVGNEFADESLLLFRAAPDRRSTSIAVLPRSLTGSIFMIRYESGGLNFLIHTLLQGEVESTAFGCHIVDVGDFGFDTDAELMTAVAWEPEAFAVIGDEFKCHYF